jgi:hypothetical protein
MSTNLAIRIEKFDGKLERTDWVLVFARTFTRRRKEKREKKYIAVITHSSYSVPCHSRSSCYSLFIHYVNGFIWLTPF